MSFLGISSLWKFEVKRCWWVEVALCIPDSDSLRCCAVAVCGAESFVGYANTMRAKTIKEIGRCY
jgi:hypothetical protein